MIWREVVLVLCIIHNDVVFANTEYDNKRLLDDTFSAVEGLLKFFSSDYSSINVDGLFGLRIGQGNIGADDGISENVW